MYNVLFYFTVKFTKFEFGIFGTARIACGAGSMKRYGDRPSVCLSVPSGRRTPLLQVCCCGLGGQDINRLLQQRRAICGQCHVVSVRR